MAMRLMACLLALVLAACATSPAQYASTLPSQDAKWNSPACLQMRTAAASYDSRERPLYWSVGALLGPYGLGVVAAGKEHQAKQRKLFARDMHLACSSRPLPKDLDVKAPARK